MKVDVTIVDEPHEKLTITSGDNDVLIINQKRRHCAVDEWNTKIIIFNRREVGQVLRAISQFLTVGVASG